MIASVQVMKMIMPLLAPAAGHLRPQLLGGAIMKAGDLIASLDLDDPAATSKAQPFTGAFPDLGPPIVFSSGVDVKFSNALNAANMIMAGEALPLLEVARGAGQRAADCG